MNNTEWGYTMKNNPDVTKQERRRWFLFLGALGSGVGLCVWFMFSLLQTAI